MFYTQTWWVFILSVYHQLKWWGTHSDNYIANDPKYLNMHFFCFWEGKQEGGETNDTVVLPVL